MVESNSYDIYTLWAIFGPIFVVVGWWVTIKNVPGLHARIIILSLIVAVAGGSGWVGTDSAAIIIPAWSLLTPKANFVGLMAIAFWWVIALIIHYVFYFVYRKLKPK